MNNLKIAILSQLDTQTITKQLAPRLRERGHQVDIIDLSTVSKTDFINQPEIQALTQYDIVYYRSGLNPSGNSGRIIELEDFLKQRSIKTVNLQYTKHPHANSKIYETEQAKKTGFAIPISQYSSTDDFYLLSEHLGLPFVIKTEYGTGGTGVYLIHNSQELSEVRNNHLDSELLYQSFIPHDFEYRVHMMGEDVVCIYKKASQEGNFRSNESQGAEMIKVDPVHVEELSKLGKNTSSIFNFEIFVADFMLDQNTGIFYFTEINLNPGWELNDHTVTGVDMMGLTVDYFEKIGSQKPIVPAAA